MCNSALWRLVALLPFRERLNTLERAFNLASQIQDQRLVCFIFGLTGNREMAAALGAIRPMMIAFPTLYQRFLNTAISIRDLHLQTHILGMMSPLVVQYSDFIRENSSSNEQVILVSFSFFLLLVDKVPLALAFFSMTALCEDVCKLHGTGLSFDDLWCSIQDEVHFAESISLLTRFH